MISVPFAPEGSEVLRKPLNNVPASVEAQLALAGLRVDPGFGRGRAGA
jgi:hypothetical protein